jgi:hypothetical protein
VRMGVRPVVVAVVVGVSGLVIPGVRPRPVMVVFAVVHRAGTSFGVVHPARAMVLPLEGHEGVDRVDRLRIARDEPELRAARQLANLLGPYGYDVSPVPVRGCLHLKTAACAIATRRTR